MTNTYFEEMMADFGARTLDGTAVGEYAGLPYSAEIDSAGEKQRFILRFALGADPMPAVRLLRAEKPANMRFEKEPDDAGGIFVAILTPPSDFYAKSSIHTLFSRLRAALDQTGIAPPAQCPLCGLPGCDRRAFVDEAFRPVHAACLQTRLELPEKDVKPTRHVRGNVFTGILGALVGAFVGAVPVWAFALSNGSSLAVYALYAFIPIFSALLYRLARGKASMPVAAITVLAASLLAALALEQVWYWLWLTTETGLSIPFSDTVRLYFTAQSFGAALKKMWLCLLVLMVGYIASGIFLRRYAGLSLVQGRVVRGAAYVRASAAQPAASAAQPAAGAAQPAAGAATPAAGAAETGNDNTKEKTE